MRTATPQHRRFRALTEKCPRCKYQRHFWWKSYAGREGSCLHLECEECGSPPSGHCETPCVLAGKVLPMKPMMLAMLSLLAALLCSGVSGCTPAELAGEQKVFSAVETACQAEALVSSVIPVGTPASEVAADIEVACNIAVALDQDVQTVVTSFEASQAAAGTAPPAGATYMPTPMAARARAAKNVRAFGASPK
jgi:hypothetical protein